MNGQRRLGTNPRAVGTNPRAKGNNPRATDPEKLARRFARAEAAASRQRAYERRHRYHSPASERISDLLAGIADTWELPAPR